MWGKDVKHQIHPPVDAVSIDVRDADLPKYMRPIATA